MKGIITNTMHNDISSLFIKCNRILRSISHFKIAKNHRYTTETSENWGTASGFGGGGWQDPNDPNNDKNKTNNDEHPHGIYKDAPYHHKNARGNKSKCPNDGQHCLDYSRPTEGKERIAIEGNNFVILKYTSPGQYHGYIVPWEQLENTIKNILIKHGFVKKSGKIIKQIIEKSLL